MITNNIYIYLKQFKKIEIINYNVVPVYRYNGNSKFDFRIS